MTRSRGGQCLALAGWALLLGAFGCSRTASSPVTASGALEATEVVVSSRGTGAVLALPAAEGDSVAHGEVLARIDVQKLIAQRGQLEAEHAAARANVTAADRTLRQTAVQRENLTRTRARVAALVADTAATRQELDDVDASVRALSEGEGAARATRGAMAARENAVTAQADVLAQQIADGTVRSPIDGVVLTRYAEIGEFVLPGQALYTIADLAHMWVRVYVGERDLGRVRVGSAVRVAVDALPGRTLSGRVSWIASRAEFTPKNVQTRDARAELVFAVKVAVDNPGGALAIGMPADVTFTAP